MTCFPAGPKVQPRARYSADATSCGPSPKQMYGIPRERVIGSAAAVRYRDGELYRTKDVEQPIDDVPMLRTARFGLLIRHDDASREFAYDTGAEKALAEAKEHGWTVVSMHNDFKVVFDL
jgi:hypothetical protein